MRFNPIRWTFCFCWSGQPAECFRLTLMCVEDSRLNVAENLRRCQSIIQSSSDMGAHVKQNFSHSSFLARPTVTFDVVDWSNSYTTLILITPAEARWCFYPKPQTSLVLRQLTRHWRRAWRRVSLWKAFVIRPRDITVGFLSVYTKEWVGLLPLYSYLLSELGKPELHPFSGLLDSGAVLDIDHFLFVERRTQQVLQYCYHCIQSGWNRTSLPEAAFVWHCWVHKHHVLLTRATSLHKCGKMHIKTLIDTDQGDVFLPKGSGSRNEFKWIKVHLARSKDWKPSDYSCWKRWGVYFNHEARASNEAGVQPDVPLTKIDFSSGPINLLRYKVDTKQPAFCLPSHELRFFESNSKRFL